MLKRKGQNIAEYSILIALVIAAAVAMQTYIRRGVQGRMADAVDHAPGVHPVIRFIMGNPRRNISQVMQAQKRRRQQHEEHNHQEMCSFHQPSMLLDAPPPGN